MLLLCVKFCFLLSPTLLTFPQGNALLRSPYFNKGSAFSDEERKEFGLIGLLPSAVHPLDEQLKRAYDQYKSCGDDLAKNTFMESMKEQNQVLYYAVSVGCCV